MRFRFLRFIAVIQSILFLAHWVVYQTSVTFFAPIAGFQRTAIAISMAVLSVSFVASSLLAWRSCAIPVRLLYTISAVWLGALSFLFWASCACWFTYALGSLTGRPANLRLTAGVFFAAAVLIALAALINASLIRVRRISVTLPNLPEAWKGRQAAFVSDLHLGQIRNVHFARRVVRILASLQPDVVFVPGDFYDGTAVNAARVARPWCGLKPRWGTYFVAGNHEEFRNTAQYMGAIRAAGIRVLAGGEKVALEGLQIVGVSYRETTNAIRLRSILDKARLDRGLPSILLAHAPNCLPIAEQAGFSLQLSGHTHGGQFYPYTWIAYRVYRQYVHGLRRYGHLTVFTTWGVGTWGPPLRLGTSPEIILIRFD